MRRMKVFEMKSRIIASSTLVAALAIPLGIAPASSDSDMQEVGTGAETMEVDPGTPSDPLSNPETAITRTPDNGGSWMGPNSANSPSRQGDVRTDATTAAGVASALTGLFNPAAGLVASGATAIYGATADTVYYDQYNYVESSPTGATLQTATVRYFYKHSSRNSEDFLERTVSYGSMTE